MGGIRFTVLSFLLTFVVGFFMAFMNEPARVAVAIIWSCSVTYGIVHYHVKWLEKYDKKYKDVELCASLNTKSLRTAGVSLYSFTRTSLQAIRSGYITAYAKAHHLLKSLSRQ